MACVSVGARLHFITILVASYQILHIYICNVNAAQANNAKRITDIYIQFKPGAI